MSRIVLTFKNNDKEKAIEAFLESKLSPSGYIKEVIWEIMNNGTISVPVKTEVEKPEQQEEVIDETVVKPKKPKVAPFGKK